MFTKDKIIIQLTEYLAEVFGNVRSLKPKTYSLPLYLRGYAFYEGQLLGVPLSFASAKEVDARTPLGLRHAYAQLKERIGREVVFVFARMGTQRRNQLIRYLVPFVVPGQQLFFPPYIRFQERVPAGIEERNCLSPIAQALVVRDLVCHDAEGKNALDLAKMLSVSKMAISKAVAELASSNVCSWDKSWPRHLNFRVRGRALWDALLPKLRTPVLKSVYSDAPKNRTKDWVEAGLSALSRRTMMSPDDIPVFACFQGQARDLSSFATVAYRDEAKSELQFWRYRPDMCIPGQVDSLSLYLSLKDDADPRVQKELSALLEAFPWN